MNFIRYIKNNIFTIGSCLLLTLFYLLVIGVTYALLSYNVPSSTLGFIFSVFVYIVETLLYLCAIIGLVG